MVGEGEILDQHGNVGPWRNMGPLPDSVKYVIEEESADVLDICVKVVTRYSQRGSVFADYRLWKHCSHL
jgi:hypothetical protein